MIEQLATFRSLKAVHLLDERLEGTENSYLKQRIVISLGTVRSPTAIDTLSEKTKASNHDVRLLSAEALGRLGSERAVEPLLGLLKDPEEDLRWATLISLGIIGDKRARNAVSGVFRNLNENPRVRSAAAVALLAFQQQEGLPKLTELATSERVTDREELAGILGAFKTNLTTQVLIEMLDDENINVRIEASK